MKLLIIIPAYNEAMNIERVVEELKNCYSQYDYIVINDGSRDETAGICHKQGYPMISFPVNLGLSGAFQAGMKYADRNGYDYAVQLDADGQHNPVYIEAMLRKMWEGYDIVIGSRFEKKKKPWSPRMAGGRFLAAMVFLTSGCRISDPTSGLRLYNRKMIREFARNINYGPEPDTLSFLAKQGIRIANVPVVMHERVAGESYLTFSRSVIYMLRMTVSILIINNFRK